MPSWMTLMINTATFLGAGASAMGEVGGGPVNPGVSKNQPLSNRSGDLSMNFSCGSGNGCGCSTPMPPDDGSNGVQDIFLCLNWIPDDDPN